MKTVRKVIDAKQNVNTFTTTRWTEPYDYTDGKRGVNLCGDPSVDENKFLYFADV